MSEDDEELLDWVLEFNKFDLYTKADVRPDVEKLWPYYQALIDKYLPGKLCCSRLAWSEPTQHIYPNSVGLNSDSNSFNDVEYRHFRDQDPSFPTPREIILQYLRNKIFL
ncbi:hypothetical protein PC111_g3789 [Phytophthora cactorum]|nr:hypothetical protein PC111_g3789 [Phytophthora cactorum]